MRRHASLPKVVESSTTWEEKMMTRTLVLLSLFASALVISLGQAKPNLPDLVRKCLARDEFEGKVKILTDQKPYILRGDFDVDGVPDYALAIKGLKTRRNGVLICSGRGDVVMLGAEAPKDPPFSDMPDDNFVAPRWRVMSKREANTLYNYDGDKPVKVASPKGGSIAMLWEDGICLIYWDGSRYRWGCGQ